MNLGAAAACEQGVKIFTDQANRPLGTNSAQSALRPAIDQTDVAPGFTTTSVVSLSSSPWFLFPPFSTAWKVQGEKVQFQICNNVDVQDRCMASLLSAMYLPLERPEHQPYRIIRS